MDKPTNVQVYRGDENTLGQTVSAGKRTKELLEDKMPPRVKDEYSEQKSYVLVCPIRGMSPAFSRRREFRHMLARAQPDIIRG